MSKQDHQGSTRVTRKSLKTLQHTASDRENLVGRPSKTLKHQLSQDSGRPSKTPKHQLSQDSPVDVEVKRKNVSTKETQADFDTKITVDDLTNPEGASEKYWQILAEKRQVALQDALDENEKLRKIIEDLKEKNSEYKQMLEEANSFIEVIKEELGNAENDDTGIDVNDISTADETIDGDRGPTTKMAKKE